MKMWLSVTEAAELMGCSRHTVTREIKRGSLPATRIGQREFRIRPSDVDSYLNERRVTVDE